MPTSATIVGVVLTLLSMACEAKAKALAEASGAALAKGEWPAYGGTVRRLDIRRLPRSTAALPRICICADLLTRPFIRPIRR
jgi:hypothetical protein